MASFMRLPEFCPVGRKVCAKPLGWDFIVPEIRHCMELKQANHLAVAESHGAEYFCVRSTGRGGVLPVQVDTAAGPFGSIHRTEGSPRTLTK